MQKRRSTLRPGIGAASRRRLWGALTLLALLAVVGGCKKNAESRRPQPVASNAPASNPIVDPYPMTTAAHQLFDAGQYAEAANAYEQILDSQAEPETPETLFRLAVAHALEPDSASQQTRIVELLKKILERPEPNRFKPFAQAMLDILDRNRTLAARSARDGEKIKQLSDELERLKKIDLRQRPPDRR